MVGRTENFTRWPSFAEAQKSKLLGPKGRKIYSKNPLVNNLLIPLNALIGIGDDSSEIKYWRDRNTHRYITPSPIFHSVDDGSAFRAIYNEEGKLTGAGFGGYNPYTAGTIEFNAQAKVLEKYSTQLFSIAENILDSIFELMEIMSNGTYVYDKTKNSIATVLKFG